MATRDDLASANVNRTYSLAATTIAIFTFTLVFLYPRLGSGEADPLLFQATLVVMAVPSFSFVVAAFLYYGASLPDRIADDVRAQMSRRGDRLWLLGMTILFLDPSLILFTVRLYVPALAWLVLWVVYLVFAMRSFPRMQSRSDG